MDMMALSNQSKAWSRSAKALTSGMGALDIEPDIMQRMAGALSLFTGIAQMGAVANNLIGMMRTMTAAEAVAETTVRTAEGPPGWAMIALALGVSTAVGTAIGTFASQCDMTVNTDSPSELKMVASIGRR